MTDVSQRNHYILYFFVFEALTLLSGNVIVE